jgi:polyisoprenoid-binding protein YceI
MTLSIAYTIVNVVQDRHLGHATATALILYLMVPGGAAAQGVPLPVPPDSSVYRLSPRSVLEVHAGKSGLLAGFGHEHRVRAHAFAGEIVYYPEDPARARVSITVLTDSLRVVPEADSADIPKIAETMRTKTLKVDSFPEITFVSREVAAADSGGRDGSRATPPRIRVTGDLTMVGRTRPVTVDMDLTIAGDTLRADGSFVVQQTDFGIKPYSKALGMVKVKNEVRFELHVVATRRAEPADAH